MRIRTINSLSHEQLSRKLSPEEIARLEPVAEKYAFRITPYYTRLIDWSNPKDPLRRYAVPDVQELEGEGFLDPSDEHLYRRGVGIQHKYQDTALLLVAKGCFVYCRACFRKRFTMLAKKDQLKETRQEVTDRVEKGLEYIANHPEIKDVLLTGGDPFVLPTEKLEGIISQISEIGHVERIRIGSRTPAVNPYRILKDPKLGKMLSFHSKPDKKLYLVAHFAHPRELTNEAVKAVDQLKTAGLETLNQNPIVQGVNDDSSVLRELWQGLSSAGIHPYYLFQCRPTVANQHFIVPLEKAFSIFNEARRGLSGIAARARFIISHRTGKIHVLGLDDEQIYFQYWRAVKSEDEGKIMSFPRNPDAKWFDDYVGGL